MTTKDEVRDARFRKKVPLWKWILIIVLVVAMPLFFSLYRTYQLQQVFGPGDTSKPQVVTTPSMQTTKTGSQQ